MLCGCEDGDSAIGDYDDEYLDNVTDYLLEHGYYRSVYQYATQERDFTKPIGDGWRRYQAIISPDEHYIEYVDGPELSPQPCDCPCANKQIVGQCYWWSICGNPFATGSVANWHEFASKSLQTLNLKNFFFNSYCVKKDC